MYVADIILKSLHVGVSIRQRRALILKIFVIIVSQFIVVLLVDLLDAAQLVF